MPNAPRTADEAGVPGLYVDIWSGAMGAQGHSQKRGLHAKRGGRGSARQSENLSSIGRDWPGDIPREKQTPKALAALQKQNREAVAN